MNENAMLVLSGRDEHVMSDEIANYAKIHWPKCRVVLVRGWAHGGIVVDPDAGIVLTRIMRFFHQANWETT